jgi:predicted KAP-like P-loop ATPase
MAVMENTWYLPEEALYFRNYPEVASVMPQLEDILAYAMRVNNAIIDYNSRVFDKIDVDVVALKRYINLCRATAEVLGRANNVCFDLLVELREIQNVFQTVMYLRNRYGSKYVGKPTNVTEVDTSSTDTI